MKKHTQIPPVLLKRALLLWINGHVHFLIDQNGSIIKENEDFLVFRKVVVTPKDGQQIDQNITLKIFFRFKRFSLKINRILSLIPIPFIIAQPGFRSKTWAFGKETGTFHGLYEWDSIENAKKYKDSLPLRLMKRRAVSNTLIYEISDPKRIKAE